MPDRRSLTEKLVSELPDEYNTTVNTAMLTWWYNIRDLGGMRLTDVGFAALTDGLGLEPRRFDIPENYSIKNKRLLLSLDRKLKWPYYLDKKHIYFFSDKEAMMAELYPDLKDFLDLY